MSVALAQAGPVIPDFGTGSDCVRDNGTFCWGWFQDNWSDLFVPAIGQHVKLTAIAIGLGFLIAASLALLAHRLRWTETPIVAVTGTLYTIPSLALFELLVPIFGLKVLTAEIALVSYTLLIIFRNMLEGLRGVPEETLDAARGMGLSRAQILLRVELPLALPAIIAGLRVATVTVISLATVAAFIIDEGLGSPIFNAIQGGAFKTELIAAGALAVALALVADAALVILQRVLTPWAASRRTA